jgi:aspartate aminotransferase
VISDEIFKDVLLDKNQQPFSIGAVEGMENLTITLSGLGKSMGLVGLRLSYGCIPDWLIGKLPEPSSGISKPVEKAAIYALQDTFENQEYLQMSMREYNKRLKIIKQFVINMDRELNKKFNIDILNAGFFIKLYIEPKATNVALVSFQGLKGKYSDKKQINSSVDLAFYILEKTGVALTPGEVFLIKGEKMVLRIPLAAQNLDLGLERIRKALLELKTKESY